MSTTKPTYEELEAEIVALKARLARYEPDEREAERRRLEDIRLEHNERVP